MKRGKKICETLKGIRHDIAAANGIDYTPSECTHEGDCAGTCPKCESETRWLERQLRARQALGKAVTIAGLSVALGAMSSCNFTEKAQLQGEVPDSTYCTLGDSASVTVNENDDSVTANRFTPLRKGNDAVDPKGNDDEEEQLMGDVAVDENGNIGDL